MSLHGSAVPPEIQEQAAAYALELWRGLETDALREGIDPGALAAVKPLIVGNLQLAFGKGALVVFSAGLDQLQRLSKRRRR